MPEQQPKERMIPTFEQVKEAYRAFAGDYGIVSHPHTPFRTPFESPNGPDALGHRQYSVTSIEGLDQQDYDSQVAEAEILFVGCMDKDGAGPGYAKLAELYPGKKIMVMTMAGGVVQAVGERTEALHTVTKYIGDKAAGLETVVIAGHENKCGYVAHVTGEQMKQDGIEYGSTDEHRIMKGLIADGANTVRGNFPAHVDVKPALLHLNRQTDTTPGGPAEFDFDFESVTPLTLAELTSA